MDDEAVRSVMNEPTEHRVRLHGKSGPPPWQRRSRWFPHIDAGDGLVMSSVLLVILIPLNLVLLLSMSHSTHGSFDSPTLIATDDGYELIEDYPGKAAGFLICRNLRKGRGYFGPSAVVEWEVPIVWLQLEPGYTINQEQCAALVDSIPSVSPRFRPTKLIRVDLEDSTHATFEYEPGPRSIVWSGIVKNIIGWLFVLFEVWSVGWFRHSLYVFFDPRRKRAIKLAASLCPRCNYDVRLIESPRCPECGELLTIEPERVGPATSE